MPIKPGVQQARILMHSRIGATYSRIHRVYSPSQALHSRIHQPYSRIRAPHSKIHVLHTIRCAWNGASWSTNWHVYCYWSDVMDSPFRSVYSRIHRVYSPSRALHSRLHWPYLRIRPSHSKIHVLHTIRQAWKSARYTKFINEFYKYLTPLKSYSIIYILQGYRLQSLLYQ